MASMFDWVDEGQEGGVDATKPQISSGAIDSGRLRNAIKQTESGGQFATEGLSGEYGSYQFMPATWDAFSNEYNKGKGSLVQTPETEEAVAQFKIDQWLDKGFTVEQVAAKWNSGSEKNWEKKRGINKNGVEYDVPAYVKNVVKAYGPGAEPSPKAATPEQETFGQVIDEARDKDLNKLQEIGGMLGGWAQEAKAALGDVATTLKVNEARKDYQELLSDPRVFNETVARLPFKKRIEFSKKMREENLGQEQRVDALAAYFEQDVKENLVKRYQKWHDSLGESDKPVTTGLLSHVDIIGRGLARSWPVMFSNIVGNAAGGKMGGFGAGMAGGYMLYKGNKFEEYREHDVEKDWAHDVSDWAAWSLAGVESASDLFQVKKILSRFGSAGKLTKVSPKVVDGFMKGMLKGAASEGMEEYTQAHIETMFDVLAAGGPEMSGDEWAERTMAIFKHPDFQRGAVTDAIYGFAGGAAMQAGGAGAAKAVGVFQNKDGLKKPKEGEETSDSPVDMGKGRHFQGADTSSDVRTQAPNDQMPTVEGLMGAPTKQGEGVTPADTATEADVQKTTPGRSLSNDLTTTPEMQTQQKETKASISGMLDDMKIKKTLKKDKVSIQNNERELEVIGELYNDAVLVEDHESALELAEQYKDVAGKQIESVTEFIAAREADLGKKQSEINLSEKQDAMIYAQDLGKTAGDMVNSQVSAIQVKENQQFMDWNDRIHEDPVLLKESLVQQETESGNLKSPDAKLYRKVADIIDKRRWMSDDQFLGKAMKIDKVLELKGDLERKLAKEKADPKVSGYQKAVDDASLQVANDILEQKHRYDSMNADAEYGEQLKAEKEAAQKEKEAAAKAKETSSRKKVTGRREDKHKAINKQKKEERSVAKKTSEFDKRRKAIQKQQASVRKAPATPVTEDRKYEIEQSKKRKAEIAKQKEFVKAGERTAKPKPKAKAKKPSVELNKEQLQVNDTQVKKARKQYRSAAIQYKGKTYEGVSHADAVIKNPALEKAINEASVKDFSKLFVEGFVQHDGTFRTRDQASKEVGVPVLGSEDFLLDKVYENRSAQSGIEVGDFSKMTLEGKMGTLEAMDELQDMMKTGKYKFLFDATKKQGVKTYFVTSPGQFRNILEVHKLYVGSQSLNEAAKRFDGQQGKAGAKGIFLRDAGKAGVAVINLPIIKKHASNLDQALETVVHEHVHGLTKMGVDNLSRKEKNALGKELQTLWESIPADLREKLRNNPETHPRVRMGIKQVNESLPELITYGLAHPEFAAWLDSMPASPRFKMKSSKIKSMWDAVVDLVVKKVLKKPTKLNELNDILNRHMKLGKADTVATKQAAAFELGAEQYQAAARENLDNIKNIDTTQAQADFLRTGNDGLSVTGKIHEMRDQSELNWNRFTNTLEQDFLAKFGGRKTKISVLGSGRKLNTSDTELLQKAMNMYIDSGRGDNLLNVKQYIRELEAKSFDGLTNREKAQLLILDRMLNLSAEEKAWANEKIRPYYEDVFKFAQENDLINSHVDDYVKRTWKMPKAYKDAGVSWSGRGTTGFTVKPTSGKPRTLNSIVDGWRAGMDLQTDGVIENLQNYGTELGYVFANRKFIEYIRSLIDFQANPWVIEVNPKTSPDFKPAPGYSKITDSGFMKPGHTMYAKDLLAKEINKIGAKPSRQLWDNPIMKFVRRLNATLKSTILSVSMFHHLAGLRSYAFGVSGKGAKFNGVKAYKRGLKKIDEHTGFTDPHYKHLGPIVDLLVREGLTIGKTQDWDQAAIQESILEQFLLNRKGKLSAQALAQWQAARRKKRSLTGGLFNRLFAGLKAEGASYELIHSIKKQESKLGRPLNDSEIKLTAAQTAALVNADFGGLHLKRMGRNPDIQRILQLVMLAPDWTESNWRTVAGMIPGGEKILNKVLGDNAPIPGMHKVYRKFWRGIAVRGLISVALANTAILTLFGDSEDWEDYGDMLDEQFSMKNFAKGKWLSTPMGPVYRKLGMEDPEKRPLLSVMGHFKDILKLGDYRALVKHKVSPAGRIFETIWSGTDWKGARFTTLKELIESGGFTAENKFADKLTGPGELSTTASLIGYNMRQSLPIFGSEFLQYLQGESSGLSSLLRAGGVDIRDTRRMPVAQQDFTKISKDINKLDLNLEKARTIGDKKMIFNARKDIKDYKDFNKIKAKIGSTKRLVAIQDRQLKPLKLKEKEGIKLSERELAKMQKIRDRKRDIYEKAMEVLDR